MLEYRIFTERNMKIMVAALAVVGIITVLLPTKAEATELKVTDKVRYK